MPVPRTNSSNDAITTSSTDDVQTLIEDLKLDFRININDFESALPDGFLEEVSKAFSIIGKYKEGVTCETFSPLQLQNDCLALQAILSCNSQSISGLMSHDESFDDSLKVIKSKTALEAKRLKKQRGLKITVEDLKDVTQVALEELVNESLTLHSAAEFAKFFYYTVRDFAAFLDRATARSFKFDPEGY